MEKEVAKQSQPSPCFQQKNNQPQQDQYPFPFEEYQGEEQQQNQNKNQIPEYKIIVKQTRQSLDITGASKNENAQLIQWPQHGNANQRFRISSPTPQHLEQGYVTIQCVHSGLFLQAKGGSVQAVESIVQAQFTGKDEQLFQMLQQREKNTFVIKNKKSGQVFDVYGGQHQQGTRLIQYPLHGNDNQVFYIEEY